MIGITVTFTFHNCYFLVLNSFYQSFVHCTKGTNYNWYHRHFHVPQFLQFPNKVQVLILLFAFFQFYSVAKLVIFLFFKIKIPADSLFLLNNNDIIIIIIIIIH